MHPAKHHWTWMPLSEGFLFQLRRYCSSAIEQLFGARVLPLTQLLQ
jgi:hypothetical protein